MKRRILYYFLSCLLYFLCPALFLPPVLAQTCLPNTNLSQHDPGDFTFVLITDTHTGGPESGYAYGNFAQVTKWIADHKAELNIQFLFHTGDVTAGDRVLVPPMPPLADQWLEASLAMKNLEWNVWYSIITGNRDDITFFNQYFGPAHFAGQPWYGSGFTTGVNASSYFLFSAQGYDFVVFSGSDYARAQQIFQQFPNRNAIYTTHIYINLDGSVALPAIQNMIKASDNVFLALNGHTHCYPTTSSICRNTITNNFGHSVYQITHPATPAIRLYMFRPGKNVICAYTYNPLTNTFYTNNTSQFSLAWNLRFNGTASPAPTPSSAPSPTAGLKPGDANGDGLVNKADLIIWAGNYAKMLLGASSGDFDNSNKVNVLDYGIWANNF